MEVRIRAGDGVRSVPRDGGRTLTQRFARHLRLIEPTELLFTEWYVARADREERLRKIGAIAEEKAKSKEVAPAPPADGVDG